MIHRSFRFIQTAVRAQDDSISSFIKSLQNGLPPAVQDRLKSCSPEFLRSLVADMRHAGFQSKQITQALVTHEDWTKLTSSELTRCSQLFRELPLTPEVFRPVLAGNPAILNSDLDKLKKRLFELKNYFTNAHLDVILPKSPHLLTDSNLSPFRYKFVYIFVLMGIRQREMSGSYVFNYQMKHVRERHLFLQRTFFYDRPNKKGITRVKNPKLSMIVDLNLREYLKRCTFDQFTEADYQVFCDYLAQEYFENELLGEIIEKPLRKQILEAVRHNKHINFLEEFGIEDQ